MALLHSARYQQSLRRYQAQRVRRHKLSPPWEGPYIIAEVLKPGTYKLANENGEVFTNAWNIQQLRRFYRLYSYLRFPEIIKEYALLNYFLGTFRTLGGSDSMNIDVRLALPPAKPRFPRGLLREEPPNVPKNRQRFFEIFPSRP